MDRNIKTILLTGGTGSFGNAFIYKYLSDKKFKGVIRIFSRDEFKQHGLQKKYGNDKRLRFLLGDVRDLSRLQRALHNVDLVVHAAALKHVPILEYNPIEAVNTNINGSKNVIDGSIDAKVEKVLLVSTDKAVSPVNLYGATKMVAEKLFIQANSYSGNKTKFSVARYGNVLGSRGSVIPVFEKQAEKNVIEITDTRMTRFSITLPEAIVFIKDTIKMMNGGEIFVPKIPSFKIIDLARAISEKANLKVVGIRPGEKLHETLIGSDESRHTREFKKFYLIEPEFSWWGNMTRSKNGKKLKEGFIYSSETNDKWLKIKDIKTLIAKLSETDGHIFVQ